jgi:hypothetical protein
MNGYESIVKLLLDDCRMDPSVVKSDGIIAFTYQQCMDMKVLSSYFSSMEELILVLLITTEIIAFTYQLREEMKVLSSYFSMMVE